MKTLICIPTFNERENLAPFTQAVLAVVPQGTEIMIIDDGSPDGTGLVADELVKNDKRIHVIHRKGKLGLATAYFGAFDWALERGFDWCLQMDADFSHDPLHLKEFFRHMNAGADVVCGSRYIEGGGVSNWPRHRLLLSRSGSLYSRIWLRYDLHDWTGGFCAWSADTLRALRYNTIHSRGYAFQIEMKYRAQVLGRRLVETPIVFQERRSGVSKMSGSIVKEALIGVIRLRLSAERGDLFRGAPEPDLIHEDDNAAPVAHAEPASSKSDEAVGRSAH